MNPKPRIGPLLVIALIGAAAPAAQCASVAGDADLRRCRAIDDNASRLRCYDALTLAPAAAANAAPAAAAAGRDPASTFGLPLPAHDEPSEVNTSLAGTFEGWGPRSRFKLANGQVWEISDDSSGVYFLHDPKVTVRRAAFGTYMLEIEGARKSPRVRRVE